jgi:hypothetical protein
MLELTVGGEEFFNEETNEFYTSGAKKLQLEHSLVSLSKWESKFQKPFLEGNAKTLAETEAYIYFMIKTPGVDSDIVSTFSQEHHKTILDYINSNQSATTFGDLPERRARGEIITSELIYYWMVAFNIPWDCQKWHLNRLFSLIRICNIKHEKPKKMSRAEVARRNAELNAKRREQYNTRG